MGLNDCQIGRVLAIPRGTVRDWRRAEVRHSVKRFPSNCPRCDGRDLDDEAYAYLLGLYLGDGYLSACPRGVFKLRIALDQSYPHIIGSCKRAMATVRQKAGGVGVVSLTGCVEVYSYWKHWPCLFPQHAAGPKHKREIRLEHWQLEKTSAFPRALLRGLINSDGCRDLNPVHGKCYPRYQFANFSQDIRRIFCETCDLLSIHWTHPYWKTIAVSRRRDVEHMDEFIGPKR